VTSSLAVFEASSAGTNLKVGDRSGAKVGEGAPIQREAGKKIFHWSYPSTFWL